MNNYALPDDEDMVDDTNQYAEDVSDHYSDQVEDEDQAQPGAHDREYQEDVTDNEEVENINLANNFNRRQADEYEEEEVVSDDIHY